MKGLKDILLGIDYRLLQGDDGVEINNIIFDSREAGKNDLFVAVHGTQVDGHEFIGQAIDAGAKVIVLEKEPEQMPDGVTFIKVQNSARVLGIMSSNFFEQPSHSLDLVGITGTNGKTTTTTLLYNLFEALGYKCGLISTIRIKIHDRELPATHTTPDPVRINKALREMADEEVTHVFMEVSSHALEQNRVSGLKFSGGVFTNISHDHLDYHGSFKNYINAKKKLFDILDEESFALTNIDDKRGMVMLQNTIAQKKTYSLKKLSNYKARLLETDITGMQLMIDDEEFHTRLTGKFNAYNLLAAYSVARELGMNQKDTLQALSKTANVEGRFELIRNKKGITGVLDYAHTPDALENVLKTIKDVNLENGQIITLVGCGGNRDKEKRPQMARIATDYSDQVILTSDNPRYEEPEAIIADMEKGISPTARGKTLTITNREQAIKTACTLARGGDIILVAGKGHEKYQEIKGVRHDFDDKAILSKYLNEVAN